MTHKTEKQQKRPNKTGSATSKKATPAGKTAPQSGVYAVTSPTSGNSSHVKATGKKQESASAEKPMTGAQLLAYWQKAGVLGAWSNREDILDNGAFARELRHQADTREH
jgi:hypothetical protein